MNITPTKQEWIAIYLKTYHKPPYTELKLHDAEEAYKERFQNENE